MLRLAVPALAAALAFATARPAAAQQPPATARPPAAAPVVSRGRDAVLRNFRFASGDSLAELRVHYITLGTPQRDAGGRVRNAVLILHGTTGSGAAFLAPGYAGRLFGPGQPLDTASHFVVLPDGIGHGASSKPSDGLRARFPRYTYDDMVDAQHRLLTEVLGVDHLLLVMGTSMGGMQSWVWAERYPAFMDAVVPLASVPTAIAGRNRMLRTLAMDAIRADPAYRGGDYGEQPRRGLAAAAGILFVMTSSPLQLHKAAPTRDSADRYIERYVRSVVDRSDANDFIYAFDASREYDPSRGLERITAPLLAINSADDEVNPPELGLMEALMPRVRRGRSVLVPTGPLTRGHGTHSVPDAGAADFAPFLAAVERERSAPRKGRGGERR
jgi:homoserine O-acetyltransferase